MTELGLTYFDIFAIIAIVVFLIIGLSRGFLKELSKILCWVISLIGAKILSYPVEPEMYKFLKVEETLRANISDVVSKVDFTNLETVRGTLSRNISSIPGVGPLLDGFVKDNWNITEMVQKGSANISRELENYLMDSLEPLAHQILNIAVFVGLFIILMIVVSIILSVLTNLFTSIKLVGAANSLLGGVLGIVKGVIFIAILYSLLFVVLSYNGSNYLSILMDSRLFDILLGIGKYIPS